MGKIVRIGNVFEFPPNIFFSDNKPNVGALMAGRDTKVPGPPDRANQWFRVGFGQGGSWGSEKAVEAGGHDPNNNGTLGDWLPVQARPTPFVKANIPALLGDKAKMLEPATLDGVGDVYIDDSLALAATKNGQYGSYSPEAPAQTQTAVDYGGAPTSRLISDSQRYKMAKELSITSDGKIWVATSYRESRSESGPHPGIALAGKDPSGKGVYDVQVFGPPEENGLPPGVYLLTIEGDDINTIGPAGQTLKKVIRMAREGNEDAAVALDFLEIPNEGPPVGGGGLKDRLVGAFLG